MKPEDLIPPCSREDRRVLIHDRIWYVPEKNQAPSDFIFPGWEHEDFFGNDQAIAVEYCSGNGAWIANKAAENPHINWVAVEIKFARVRKIWSKIKNMGLKNLIIVCGEGCMATERYFPEGSIHDVYINFPDPWPKKRHAKNRIIQPKFVDQLLRILKEGRLITLVTDDAPFSEWSIKIICDNENFVSVYPEPFYMTEETNYGTSYFDHLWRSKGRSIRYHSFQKIKK